MTEQVLAANVDGGLLGSFAFDRQGDITAPGVTVYRIEKGRPRVLTAIRPPSSLVR